jgi:hypothetical protein
MSGALIIGFRCRSGRDWPASDGFPDPDVDDVFNSEHIDCGSTSEALMGGLRGTQ